jgi:hypothetical protein
MSDDSSEQRAVARQVVKWEAELLERAGTTRPVQTRDVSERGMMFSVAGPVSVPAQLEILLSLPDGGKVALTGELRHACRRPGGTRFDVGVQFAAVEGSHSATALSRSLSAVAAAEKQREGNAGDQGVGE